MTPTLIEAAKTILIGLEELEHAQAIVEGSEPDRLRLGSAPFVAIGLVS